MPLGYDPATTATADCKRLQASRVFLMKGAQAFLSDSILDSISRKALDQLEAASVDSSVRLELLSRLVDQLKRMYGTDQLLADLAAELRLLVDYIDTHLAKVDGVVQ